MGSLSALEPRVCMAISKESCPPHNMTWYILQLPFAPAPSLADLNCPQCDGTQMHQQRCKWIKGMALQPQLPTSLIVRGDWLVIQTRKQPIIRISVVVKWNGHCCKCPLKCNRSLFIGTVYRSERGKREDLHLLNFSFVSSPEVGVGSTGLISVMSFKSGFINLIWRFWSRCRHPDLTPRYSKSVVLGWGSGICVFQKCYQVLLWLLSDLGKH